mmetsp:Transcript_11243/g.22614  ORF Transcript_11243/g.22614 Transcript_11243/m.22614 type:complete len:88 (-) Transcript_11243:1468-1731(-)
MVLYWTFVVQCCEYPMLSSLPGFLWKFDELKILRQSKIDSSRPGSAAPPAVGFHVHFKSTREKDEIFNSASSHSLFVSEALTIPPPP